MGIPRSENAQERPLRTTSTRQCVESYELDCAAIDCFRSDNPILE